MLLYDYFRSSASYRVRIALNLKGIPYEKEKVNLLENVQQGAEYCKKNASGLVPSLATDDGLLTQSMAMLEYLEEKYPEVPLLPNGIAERAMVRALAMDIACDIHPIDNLRVLKYLVAELGASEAQKLEWYRHWVRVGFAVIERKLSASSDGKTCFAGGFTVADACLVPQVYNANRFELDMSPYPLIASINDFCLQDARIASASPDAD